MKRRNIIMVMMTSLLLGSCSSEDILSVPNGNGRIRFDVGVSQSQEVAVKPMNGGATRSAEPLFLPTSSIEMHSGDMTMYANCASTADIPMHNIVREKTTRGTEINTSNFYNSFGLFGYFYDSDKSWTTDGSSLYPETSMNDLQITQSASSWTTSVYWPGSTKKSTFFAYAPHNCEGVSWASPITGAPNMTYTVPQNVSDQKDLLVAKSTEDISCDGKTSVALTFKHALSAIKFVKGDTPGYKEIKEIQISGVNNRGTLNMNSQSWENTSGSDTYSISTIDENTVCFLMPQSVPSGAKLSVTLTNGGTEHTFEADLDGTSWQAGHQYTYQLSINKVTGTFKFEVTPSTASIAITGGKAEFTVKSYFQFQDNTTANIPWSGSYKIGETTTSVAGEGGKTGETININIGKNESSSTHTETLQANPSKGTAQNPWNLSNSKGEAVVENTANCYVVNSQGTYSIPLVYGCAIKDGQENAIAYGKGTYKGITYNSNTFKRHDDNLISRPYLKDNGITVDDAELLWQEVQGMITEVKVENEKIVFTIGDKIAQGNALIAAKSGSTIVWSWHIWVTDRNINATEKVTTKVLPSHVYDFMPVALGWVDSSEGVSPRLYTFNLTQSQSNKDLSATVNQAGTYGGTCPYYQWGRKDPLMPSKGIKDNTETKPCYDISGKTVSFTANTSDKTIKGGILYPEKIINSSNKNWDTGTTRNDNWNAINGDTKGHNYNEVVKTVYDPSPVGFKMPPPCAFTGFTDSGSYLDSSSNTCIDKTNGYPDGFNEGYNFYTNSNNTTTTYWRACGYRAYDGGSLNNVGYLGHYWSAGPYSDTYGCHLVFDSSAVSPQDGDYRAHGFSVRPVSE